MLCEPALDVIRAENGPKTLFSLDPPYLQATRAATDTYGPLEMEELQRRELLDLIVRLRGKLMLSGYASPLYDEALAGWTRHEFELPNNAAGGDSKRRMNEVLWCNF